jgi:hypothetical protein
LKIDIGPSRIATFISGWRWFGFSNADRDRLARSVLGGLYAEALAERVAADAEIARLREALAPFAKAAEHFEREHPGWYHRQFSFAYGGDIPFGMAQLIDARAVLAKLSAKGA